MAEFPASAQTMVGNNSGSCLLHLTGAAITVKFQHVKEAPSWPYNCIRQFRADEETRQFSFFSGRRGPYGVAEYKFDMTDQMLLALQDALTQFTGAQFGGGITSTPGVSGGGGTSPVMEQRYAPDAFRSPKHDPLPRIPGTPPGDSNMHSGYMTHTHTMTPKHSATDVFATLPKEQRHRHNNSALPGRPPVPAPYHSHTLESRAHKGSPFINTKYSYHDFSGSPAPQMPPGVWNFPTPSPKPGTGSVGHVVNRKMSYGEEVFRSNVLSSPARSAKLTRQSTAPTYRKHVFEGTDSPHQDAVISPPPADGDDGTSDLDFGPLRRSSPHVDRRRGLISPPNGTTTSPQHDHYNVPRNSGSSSSPPTSESFYNVPRSRVSGDSLSQESAEVPATVAVSPTEADATYNVPKSVGNGSDVRRIQQQHRQLSTEEAPGDVGGIVIYNVPPAMVRPVQQMVKPPEDGHELYNTPKPSVTNGHELYNTPKHRMGNGAPRRTSSENGKVVYDVPHSALDSYTQQLEDDDGLYKVPRSLEDLPDTTYNVPKPSENPSNYDSLETVHNNTEANNGRGNSSAQFQITTRQPMLVPDQDAYSVPRPASSFSPTSRRRGGRGEGQRYPYDYVDHTLPRAMLKSSRSLESLVRNRVNLSPDAPSQTQPGRSHRTPSPRTREHKYIEIDIDEFSPSPPRKGQEQKRGENLYAEIPDSEPLRPDVDHYTIVPSNLPASAVNNTPMPLQDTSDSRTQSNGDVSNVSKEARALHEEGYELVLPAEGVARNLAVQHQRQGQQQQVATQQWGMKRAYSLSHNSHRIQLVKDGRSAATDWSVSQLSTSGPLHNSRDVDQYVIVNRQDVNQPTQPRDIPVLQPQGNDGVLNPPSMPVTEEQYEVMTSVRKQVPDVDKSTGGPKGPKFTMVPLVPTKKRGSVSKSASLPRSDTIGQQSVRDSCDLESIETGSRTSVASSGHLDDLVGPLSPVDSGVHSIGPHPHGVTTGKKNVIRIASGSPHDIVPSKDLKIRSNSVEHILDEDKKQKYENVTDKELAAKLALSAGTQTTGGPKKPPMPLPRPRPTRPEQ